MATTSLGAAALLGTGCPFPAWAAPACINAIDTAFNNPVGQTVANVCIRNTSFGGNITNEGTIGPSGIAFQAGTINGDVQNTGIVDGGITLDSASTISDTAPGAVGILIAGSSFAGGVNNGGLLIVGKNGIYVGGSASFGGNLSIGTASGGIANSGTISAAAANGIIIGGHAASGGEISAARFGGGINNSGLIDAGNNGVYVGGTALLDGHLSIGTFSGGIANSGAISAAGNGIMVGGLAAGGSIISILSFGGGINSTGTIVAAAPNSAIFIGGLAASGSQVVISTFSGGITNSGAIASAQFGIRIEGSAFVNGAISIGELDGAISNAGTISVGGDAIFIGGMGGRGGLVSIGDLSGGITNTGAISTVAGRGIIVGGAARSAQAITVSTLSGGIVNGGSITAGASNGIVVGGTASGNSSLTIGMFKGGISNGGMISAAAGNGVFLGGYAAAGTITVSNFAGGITNSGTIVAGRNGILVGGSMTAANGVVKISTFSGGITNSGTIAAKGVDILVGGDVVPPSTFAISNLTGNISNSGAMSGATGIRITAGVTFPEGAVLINSGTITASSAAIDVSEAQSAVTIDQNAGTINGAIKLSSGAAVLNILGGTINGNIVGAGSSDVINFALGSGTFTYSRDYGFSDIDQVNINSGTVVLNGSNSASNINVAGGVLAGTGTLDPLTVTIHAGGTLVPGMFGAPGTSMTIAGNLAFQSGALYAIYFNATTSTFIDVTGVASLAGTVEANVTAGLYRKTTFDILSSAGLGGTTFSSASTNPPNYSASLAYTPTDVLLTLIAALGTGTILNGNQQKVATAIDNDFNNGGSLPVGLANLFDLSGNNLANALTQLDGEDATGAERGAFDLMNEFLGLILDPALYGRGLGQSSGGELNFAADEQARLPSEVALAYAGLLKSPPKPQSFNQRWTAWGSAFGSGSGGDGDPIVGSNNITTSSYGYAGGMDYHYSPDTVFGFALAGGGTNWNLANTLGTGRSDTVLAGVYGITYSGPAYIAAGLAFTNNWFGTSRRASGDQLAASFQGQSYGARLEGGHRFLMPSYDGAIGLTPYAAIQAQIFHTPSYGETDLTGGSFGLSYNAMNATDARSELGGRLDDLTTLYNTPLMLGAKVAWAHDWVSNPAVNASFESLPGTNFIVNGAPVPQDSLLASARAQLSFMANWSLIAKLDSEFAAGSQLYAGSATLRHTW